MASLFAPRPGNGRRRAISNGGLGGLVQPHISDLTSEPIETGTWPRRKQRPPPLKICYDNEKLLVPAPQRSAFWQDSKSPWSPRTPTSYGSDTRIVPMVDSSATCSTPLSRFHVSAITYGTPPSQSSTPTQLPSNLIELPGSLLLPSQGFPPPPFTPSRPHILTRLESGDSEIGSVPSLSSTSSSFSEMDRFRGWKPAVSTGSTPTASASASKPFSAMSIEELFDALPSCNSFVITQMWLPAMRTRYAALRLLLQDSAELKDKSGEELTNIAKDIKLFAEEARTISNTYTNALRSAESLVERDTTDLEEGLRIYERRFREEKGKVDASNQTIKEKEDALTQLQSTLNDVVRVLGTFIQDNISQWVDSFHEPCTQAVMQVISDYSNLISETSTRYVRIPEATHNKNLLSLRDAQANVQKYRTVALSQGTFIKDQSDQLERHMQKYDQCLLKLREKNHEVLLLGEKRVELEQKVGEYETALVRSESAVLERERLRGRNEELERHLATLTQNVEDRDSQIAELRSQLGSAREEVLARRADVRNVIVQSQAMLAPAEASDTSSQSSGSKAGKILGRSKDKSKPRQPLLPHSQSALHFGFGRPLNPDLMSSPPDGKYSSKEVVSKRKKSGDLPSSTASTSSSVYSQTPKDAARPSDPFHDARPRADSLGALDAMRQTVKSPRADTQKQLPTPPPAIVATPPSHPPPALPHGDSPMPKSFNYRQLQAYPDYSPQQTARRILSDIPEASVEDADSPRAPSATSSDREVYRRSICALNALYDFETLPAPREHLGTEGSSAMIERVESHSSDGSEPQTVSQMYHDGRQGHMRS